MAPQDTRTVLVVDDNQDLRTLVVSVLEQEGYQVQTAANGFAALEMVKQQPTVQTAISRQILAGHPFGLSSRMEL